jgi:hypothetical protein
MPQRYRIQFGLKAFLVAVAVCAILIGLFFPRFGDPLNGCVDRGLESVWIAPPDHTEVIKKCKEIRPDATIPDNPQILTEKVFEEVIRCNYFNFHGRRYLHRVRYRSELFLSNGLPYESIVVLHDYDHHHLNGGGCRIWNAK